MGLLEVGLIAFGAAALTTPVVGALARAAGIVDKPGPLKVHDKPIPLLGGIALIIAWLVGTVLAGARPDRHILIAVGIALLVGVVDDVVSLPAVVRLAGQAAAGVVLVAGGTGLTLFGIVGSVVVVFACMGAANGVNLVDGLDGLTAGATAIAAAGITIVAAVGGNETVWSAALAGAALGFLLWNRHKARIFLGDGGAYAIGVLLIALVLEAAEGHGAIVVLAGGVCLGIFAWEPVDAIARRVRTRSALSTGDRDHTYDRLVTRGMSVPLAVAAMWFAQAAFAGVGVALGGRPIALAASAGAAAAVVLLIRKKTENQPRGVDL